jgi:hypothetical protein
MSWLTSPGSKKLEAGCNHCPCCGGTLVVCPSIHFSLRLICLLTLFLNFLQDDDPFVSSVPPPYTAKRGNGKSVLKEHAYHEDDITLFNLEKALKPFDASASRNPIRKLCLYTLIVVSPFPVCSRKATIES